MEFLTLTARLWHHPALAFSLTRSLRSAARPTTVAKTPIVPPGFEPLPISVPAALPRVPSPLSTTPSALPASLPRVPTQPHPPASPAPAVDALPESPTETYQARTRNAGQRRRQRHKAQRAATKQVSKPDKQHESTTSRPTTRSILNPSKPKKRHGSKITSDTVNHVSSVFAAPPLSHPNPTPEPINHSSMPAHAFWTANAVVDPNTGKSVALLKANNQTCPLAATQCTSWITATFLQVAQPRIYASSPPSRCTKLKRTASASPLAATASTTKAKSALLRPT